MKTLKVKTTTIRIPNLKKFLFKTIKKTKNNKTMRKMNSIKSNKNNNPNPMQIFKVI